MAKSIKKNVFYNMIKVTAQIIFPLITFPYVSRVLGTANVGKVNYASAVYSYLSLVGSLSISTYAIRTCSVLKSDRKQLSSTASEIFSINIFSAAAAYILMFLVLLIPRFAPYRMLIMLYCVNILMSAMGADWINSTMEDFRYITLRTVGYQVISILLMFILVRKPEDYFRYAAISVLASAGANALNIFYRKRFCDIRFTFAIDWRKHLSPVLKFFAAVVVQQVYVNSDIIMIGWMTDDTQVGLYSTASKIFNIINTTIASVFTVVLPRASQYWGEKRYDEYNALLRKVVLFLITVGLPCIFGLIFAPEEIITVAAGHQYIKAAPALALFGLALFFSFFHGFIGNLIVIPMGDFNIGIVAALVSSLVNILLNVFMLPAFGFTAAAFTTMVAELISALILAVRITSRVRITAVKKSLLHSLTGCVLFTVWIFASRSLVSNVYLRMVVILAGSGLIYAAVLAAFRDELFREGVTSLKKKLKLQR